MNPNDNPIGSTSDPADFWSEVSCEPGFVSEDRELLEMIMADILDPANALGDVMKARSTRSYGVPYNYSNMEYPETPMHPGLLPLIDTMEERLGYRPNNCLVNLYMDGKQTMGFHGDITEILAEGTGISIVSLGAERILEFRKNDDYDVRVRMPLPSGSLFHMSADLQDIYKHRVPRDVSVTEPRVSLTFRKLLPM